MVMPRNSVAFIIIHPQISKRVNAKIILVSPATILVVNDYKWAGSLYVRSMWDVRHGLHCLVLSDTYLFDFTKDENLSFKSKMVPYYVFTSSMLWRRLLPLRLVGA